MAKAPIQKSKEGWIMKDDYHLDLDLKEPDYGPAEKKNTTFMIKIPLHKVWAFFKKRKEKKEIVRRRRNER